VIEQAAFPLNPPAIARQISVFPNNAVARNDDGCRIHGAGSSYGARRRRAADRASHLTIRSRGTVGNTPEFFPDAALESSGLHVGRKIEVGQPAAQVRDNFLNPGAEAAFAGLPIARVCYKCRTRIFLAQLRS